MQLVKMVWDFGTCFPNKTGHGLNVLFFTHKALLYTTEDI